MRFHAYNIIVWYSNTIFFYIAARNSCIATLLLNVWYYRTFSAPILHYLFNRKNTFIDLTRIMSSSVLECIRFFSVRMLRSILWSKSRPMDAKISQSPKKLDFSWSRIDIVPDLEICRWFCSTRNGNFWKRIIHLRVTGTAGCRLQTQ